MKVSLALVQFPKEKNGRYVLPIDDIVNFKPKSVDDFNPKQLYKVRWDVLRRLNSDTTEEFYDANILCLAVNAQSMLRRAAARKLKLPKQFVDETKRDSKKETGSVEDCVTVAQRASKQAKRQVQAAMKQNCEKRMQALYQAHLKDSNITSSNVKGPENKDKSPKLVGQIEEKEKEPLKPVGQNEEKEKEPQILVGPNMTTVSEFSRRLTDKELMGIEIEVPHQIELSKPEDSKVKGKVLPSIVTPKKKVGSKSAVRSLESSPVSDVSFASTSSKFRVLEERLARAQRELTMERKRARIAEESNRLLQEKLALFQSSLDKFISSVQKIKENDPGISAAKTYPTVSPRISKWVESTLAQSPSGLHKSPVSRKLFNEKDALAVVASPSIFLASPLSRTPTKGPKDVSATVLTTPTTTNVDATPKSRNQTSSSPTKSPAKSNKGMKSVKKDHKLGPNELLNDKLAVPMLKELQGVEELRRDGTGKVHLGNNVWMADENWKQFFVSSSKKISILMKDLTLAILGTAGCKKYSMTGGKSPNQAANVVAKDPIPRGILEVLYGFHRAKLIKEGITSDAILNQNMALAKKYITEKLHDTAKPKKNKKTLPQ